MPNIARVERGKATTVQSVGVQQAHPESSKGPHDRLPLLWVEVVGHTARKECYSAACCAIGDDRWFHGQEIAVRELRAQGPMRQHRQRSPSRLAAQKRQPPRPQQASIANNWSLQTSGDFQR
jgi:hypothetical protein